MAQDIALVFDIDNTLYDQLLPFITALREVVPDFSGDVLTLHKLSRYYSDEVFDQVQSGQIPAKDGNIYRIQRALLDFGVELDRNSAHRFQTIYQTNQNHINLRPEMEEALDYCKQQQITMGVITNGSSDHQWNKVKNLQLENWIPKDHIIASGDIQVAKPEKEIFQALESRLNQDPENIYYIGDSYENDIIGAGQVGWGTIWLNVYGDPLPTQVPIKPDYILKPKQSVVDLIKVLQEK